MTRCFAFVVVATLAGCEPDTSNNTEVVVVDADGDGFSPPSDCDDDAPDVFPGQVEHCDGVDEDCDGITDDAAIGGSVGFHDADGDGYGWTGSPMVSCDVGPDSGWSPIDGDCADDDATRYPGAVESCDGEDDNCDLVVDEGAFLEGVHFDTIALAVAAAQDGAVVTVCSSRHVERSILIDRDVTVRSVSGDPMLSEIDGLGGGSVFLVDGGNLVLEGFTVTGEVGTDVGVPLEASAGAVVNALTGAGGAVTVRSCVLDDNHASFGGAIAGHTVVVTDSRLDANVAARDGGAIWIDRGGSLLVERSSLDGNEAADNGGAIFATGDVSLVDVEASSNSAPYGDGGFARVDSASSEPPLVPATLDLVRSDIRWNTASSGGAFYLLAATATADDDTELLENGGGPWGGGVYMTSDGEPTSWTGGVVSGGTANITGGGFYVAPSGGLVTLADVRIEDNTAIDGGGGVYLVTDSGEAPDLLFAMSDSTVSGNYTAYSGGGGIAARDTTFHLPEDLGTAPAPVLLLERVVLSDNRLLYGDGGGLYLVQIAAEVRDSSVFDNVSDELGAGIFLEDEAYLTAVDLDLDNAPDDVALEGWAPYGLASYVFQATDQTFTCDTRTVTCL